MDKEAGPSTTRTQRHKCSGCYKQFKRKEHLIEHMKISYHSFHQPRCLVCQKHCQSFESVREHLRGLFGKSSCSEIFSDRGCNLCLKVFDSANALNEHQEMCLRSAPVPLGAKIMPSIESHPNISGVIGETSNGKGQRAVAMDCEMVGGGLDGSLDICARVCLVDEDENLIFHAYVKPQMPVTNYRYEVTGLTEDHLTDAMPLDEVKNKISEVLYNGESIGRARLDGGDARLLVGHSLLHDLECLRMSYPGHLLRDTAKYRPLMKTNLVSHSLKYLTKTYLGYVIQSGVHDPYEDCVSVMRLYKRMRAQDHQMKGVVSVYAGCGFDSIKSKELEKMTPDELYAVSMSNYQCWCLDLIKESSICI
ncbi:hypothetical protein SLEP1_g1147 [Rubroshorea leprosula]|uniref:RNA exonuclease 4 n=1 Tax=Rubroshorea leprosula TaxID=152421 RepID=A0AAV5HNT2_9ROSI|nr:hypothetical protein SLEP1_g1147 [Rubroshorea leprosula]